MNGPVTAPRNQRTSLRRRALPLLAAVLPVHALQVSAVLRFWRAVRESSVTLNE